MFTVKFDKPYTIPAEGFYAGYSFTVDDASSEENAKPIATISGANEGGLYMHSTRNMLKWLDVSEALDRSAAIQVTISGSAIKENAVAPLDGEQEFVEVNAPVETKFVVVNTVRKVLSLSTSITPSLEVPAVHSTLILPSLLLDSLVKRQRLLSACLLLPRTALIRLN